MSKQEEQLIAEGEAAQQLLGTEAFNQTVNSLVESYFQSFVNTKPEDKEAREANYYSYRGLVEMVGTLQQRVSIKDEIMNRNNNEEE